METEVQNRPEQLWNRISSVGNTQFAFKSVSSDLYLTAPSMGEGVSSLKAEPANYGNNVVVEYLALNNDGKCCIPSQMWKRTVESTGYFTLENMEKPQKNLIDLAVYKNEVKTGLSIQNQMTQSSGMF